MTEIVDIGEPVTLYADCISGAQTLYDPATISLSYTKPDGTIVAAVVAAASPAYAGVTHIGTGRFSYLIASVDQNGVWSYTWTPSSGAIQTGYFLVGATTTTDAPCEDWIRPEDVFTCSPASGVPAASQNLAVAAEMAQSASRALYVMSDRKYPGICSMTVRPCRRGHWNDGLPPTPGSTWSTYTWGWGSCGCGAPTAGACSCGGISELLLSPDYRVLGIQSVWVDGALLAATNYRVDDDRWLVRTDGDVWPASQRIDLDATAVDTFEVTFWFGAVPPADGKAAARALAAEMYGACVGLECSLPNNVRSLIRQGVTVDFSDPTVMDGIMGLRSVDRFLETERYGSRNAPAYVIDPEGTSTWRRVST